MKIGLSYSRCVRDIVDGNVDINDVLVVIARTDFDPHNDEQWKGIWEGYGGGQQFGSLFSNPEWIDYPAEDEVKFRQVSIALWQQGKFHQPRKFGARPQRMPYYWLEVGLESKDIDSNPTVKKAWEQFQILAGLANTTTVKDNF
jgi:hypothetical protein